MGCNCGQAAKREAAKQVTKKRTVAPSTPPVAKTVTRRVIKRPAR